MQHLQHLLLAITGGGSLWLFVCSVALCSKPLLTVVMLAVATVDQIQFSCCSTMSYHFPARPLSVTAFILQASQLQSKIHSFNLALIKPC